MVYESLQSKPPKQTAVPSEVPHGFEFKPHGPTAGDRLLTLAAFQESDVPELLKRYTRILNCCLCPTFRTSTRGGIALVPGRCRDRMCPTCQSCRAKEAAELVLDALTGFDEAKFLTLTLKHTTEPLRDQISHLWQSFRRLRHSPIWRANVRGGIGCMEIKKSERDGLWHVHLHALIDATFLHQRTLSAAWSVASGGSVIVDIREVHSRAQAARYLSKYIAKPGSIRVWTAEEIQAYALATAGKRFINSFGSCRHRKVEEPAPSESDRASTHLCTLRQLQTGLRSLDRFALHAASLLPRDQRLRRLVIESGTPCPCADLPLEEWEESDLIACLASVGDGIPRKVIGLPGCEIPPAAPTPPPKSRPPGLFEHRETGRKV